MTNVPLGSSVKAILEGGPTEIPTDLRTWNTIPEDHKIKVPHQGGYEHFERVDDPDKPTGSADESPAVFRWTMRTKIAE